MNPQIIEDVRVMKLAEEIADSSQRFVPMLLIKLMDFLEKAKPGSGEAVRLKHEIYQYDMCPVILLALKQDYSNVQSSWNTAMRIVKLADKVFCQYQMGFEEEGQEEQMKQYRKTFVGNLLILARRLQDRYSKSLEQDNIVTEMSSRELLRHYQSVMASLRSILKVNSSETRNLVRVAFHSPWFLQLFVTDDVDTGWEILNFFHELLLQDKNLLTSETSKAFEKLQLTIFDELVYALSISESSKIAEFVLKILLHISKNYPQFLPVWTRRYHGIKLVLMRWWNRGTTRDAQRILDEVIHCMEETVDQQVSYDRVYRSVVLIQSMWRSYAVRKRLKHANKAIGKFQTVYRKRKEIRSKKDEEEKLQRTLTYQLQSERRCHVRENQERELQLLETLPAPLVAQHIQNTRRSAATKIQATWRGSSLRNSLRGNLEHYKRERAARIIQRAVRKFLHRCQLRRELQRQKEAQRSLMVPGLTEERRHQLMNEHKNWSALHNAGQGKTREEQEQAFRHAQVLIQRRIFQLRHTRRKDHERESHLACVETDANILSAAPNLKECTEADFERFSSRSTTIANYAKQLHKEKILRVRAPWWKNLLDEDELLQDEDMDFKRDILMLQDSDNPQNSRITSSLQNQDILL